MAKRKFYISDEPMPDEADKTAFEAAQWIEVKNVGSVGETGMSTNILSYDTLDTDVADKEKGVSNAGDPEIEVKRVADDPGQIALRDAAKTSYKYGFKIEEDDAPTASYSNTIHYNRGLVSGPRRPNGRREDFVLEVFTLGLVQREVVVDPVEEV